MPATVQFRGTAEQAKQQVYLLARILTGSAPDQLGLMKGYYSSLGFAALSSIKEDFIVKARGGIGEVGGQWKPLSPATIARRRVGSGDLRNQAIRTRQKIVESHAKKVLPRMLLSLPRDEAKRRARTAGEYEATRITGMNKVETLGGRQVEILRDTGILFNSLSPGELYRGEYTPPSDEGGEQQIFDIEPGSIAVGTNVLYAPPHQETRPFLPDERNSVPATWWAFWLRVGNAGLVEAAVIFFQVPRQ